MFTSFSRRSAAVAALAAIVTAACSTPATSPAGKQASAMPGQGPAFETIYGSLVSLPSTEVVASLTVTAVLDTDSLGATLSGEPFGSGTGAEFVVEELVWSSSEAEQLTALAEGEPPSTGELLRARVVSQADLQLGDRIIGFLSWDEGFDPVWRLHFALDGDGRRAAAGFDDPITVDIVNAAADVPPGDVVDVLTALVIEQRLRLAAIGPAAPDEEGDAYVPGPIEEAIFGLSLPSDEALAEWNSTPWMDRYLWGMLDDVPNAIAATLGPLHFYEVLVIGEPAADGVDLLLPGVGRLGTALFDPQQPATSITGFGPAVAEVAFELVTLSDGALAYTPVELAQAGQLDPRLLPPGRDGIALVLDLRSPNPELDHVSRLALDTLLLELGEPLGDGSESSPE